ncbi:hypothetical protein AX16_004696 [Volvariella volvacea WC 439]|nr:hypothetical protein AX16_004696 [Volvariella volvacea WC 439]
MGLLYRNIQTGSIAIFLKTPQTNSLVGSSTSQVYWKSMGGLIDFGRATIQDSQSENDLENDELEEKASDSNDDQVEVISQGPTSLHLPSPDIILSNSKYTKQYKMLVENIVRWELNIDGSSFDIDEDVVQVAARCYGPGPLQSPSKAAAYIVAAYNFNVDIQNFMSYLIAPNKTYVPLSSEPQTSAQASSTQIKIDHKSLGWREDFLQIIKTKPNTKHSHTAAEFHQGGTQFASPELMLASKSLPSCWPEWNDTKVKHEQIHDCEAMFWLVIKIMLCYTENGIPRARNVQAEIASSGEHPPSSRNRFEKVVYEYFEGPGDLKYHSKRALLSKPNIKKAFDQALGTIIEPGYPQLVKDFMKLWICGIQIAHKYRAIERYTLLETVSLMLDHLKTSGELSNTIDPDSPNYKERITWMRNMHILPYGEYKPRYKVDEHGRLINLDEAAASGDSAAQGAQVQSTASGSNSGQAEQQTEPTSSRARPS